MKQRNGSTLEDNKPAVGAVRELLGRLSPRWQLRHHIIFFLYLGAILATWFYLLSLTDGHEDDSAGALIATVLLWAAVVVTSVIRARQQKRAALELDPLYIDPVATEGAARRGAVRGSLHSGALVMVMAGEQLPADGIVTDGTAMVDESAITGESAPVFHQSGEDCGIVKGGTTVISGWLLVKLSCGVDRSLLSKIFRRGKN